MEEEFIFSLYIHTPRGPVPLMLFMKHNQEILLSRQDTLEQMAILMAVVVTPTMLPFKLVPDEERLSTSLKKS